MHSLTLLPESFAIARLPPGDAVPVWAWTGGFASVTRTADELSIVCVESSVPEGVRAQRGWRALCVAGPLDFDLVGVLASLTAVLAGADVPTFAVSTYETDYLLVRAIDLTHAIAALRRAGREVLNNSVP